MRQQLWGRARWLWVLEAAAIACFLAVIVLADQPGTKLVALGLLLVRVVINVLRVVAWRRSQHHRGSKVSDDDVAPLM